MGENPLIPYHIRTMRYLTSILFLFATLICSSAALSDLSPPNDDAATKVYVRVFVVDVDGVNTADQSFVANAYFDAQWQDPRLAHEGPGVVVRPISEVWNPGLQILNRQRAFVTMPEQVEIHPDGMVVYRQRVWGVFSQALSLKDLPFDQHSFGIELVSV